MADTVTDSLRKERREIDGMDTVEAVHEGSLGLTVAEAMTSTEIRWGAHEKAMRLYAGAEAGGLRFAVHSEGSNQHVMRFERARPCKPVGVPAAPRHLRTVRPIGGDARHLQQEYRSAYTKHPALPAG